MHHSTFIRALAIALLASLPAAWAQSAADAFNRAPAGVEEALRDRVAKFYALHKEGKFRQAEAFVCEDSKDAFYDSDKRRWASLEIMRVTFAGDFNAAKVLVSLGTELNTRTGKIPALYPATVSWKLDSGAWCYHIPPASQSDTVTPFGVMRQAKESENVRVTLPPPPTPAARTAVLSAIKLSKNQLVVKGYEKSEDSLEIYNGMPGQMRLELQTTGLKGLKWDLTKTVLGPGERAALKVSYDPPDKSPKSMFELRLVLEPMGQLVPIPVIFDIPEEVKRQLPPGAVKLP